MRITILTFVVSAVLMLAPRLVSACSCVGCGASQLVPSDTVPANVPALFVAWFGDEWPPDVVLEDVASGSDVRFELVELPDEGGFLLDGVDLLPSRTYHLTVSRGCEVYDGKTSDTMIFTTVDEAPLPAALGPVEVVESEITPLEVADGGSCQSEIEAAWIDVAIDLDPDAERWRNAMLFETYVDGARWSPLESVCTFPPAGASWTGRAVDRLFTSCRGTGLEALPLDEGPHTVEFRASLPGSTIELVSSSLEVNLSCDPEMLTNAAGASLSEDLTRGCGCGTSGGRPTRGIGLLLLVGLALRPRRSSHG